MLGKICFLLYPVYILALVVCYLIAAFKKKYKPLAVIAVIDVVFSCIMFLRYAQYAVANETVMSFIGLCLSLYTAIVLMRYKK